MSSQEAEDHGLEEDSEAAWEDEEEDEILAWKEESDGEEGSLKREISLPMSSQEAEEVNQRETEISVSDTAVEGNVESSGEPMKKIEFVNYELDTKQRKKKRKSRKEQTQMEVEPTMLKEHEVRKGREEQEPIKQLAREEEEAQDQDMRDMVTATSERIHSHQSLGRDQQTFHTLSLPVPIKWTDGMGLDNSRWGEVQSTFRC